MGRILVTGDLHQSIDIGKLSSRRFPYGNELTKDDILIVCGDVGLVWDGSEQDKYWQNWLNDKPWTTLCAPGNHENFDLIEKYPISTFCGGAARQIKDSIWYAEFGEIFTLNNKKFLFCGKADSHDKEYRTEGVSWWAQERIIKADVEHALENLKKVDNKVDFIISHTGGTEVNSMLGFTPTESDKMLDSVLANAVFEKHYCGHYHVDMPLINHRILYDDIIELRED